MNIVTARSSTEAAKKNREAEDSADDHYQVVCKLVRHQAYRLVMRKAWKRTGVSTM
jgi:hypothetical protein